jgi:hypothetical protein
MDRKLVHCSSSSTPKKQLTTAKRMVDLMSLVAEETHSEGI